MTRYTLPDVHGESWTVETLYHDGSRYHEEVGLMLDARGAALAAGWYFWITPEGCDRDDTGPTGPFASEGEALRAARGEEGAAPPRWGSA